MASLFATSGMVFMTLALIIIHVISFILIGILAFAFRHILKNILISSNFCK